MRQTRSFWGQLRALDARFSSLSQVAHRPGRIRALAAVLAHSGDSWFWLLGLALLWWFGPEFWKYRALVLAVGVVVTALVVLVIKFSVRRSRPAGEWGQIYRRTDPHSFPSGHAARAMLLATLALGLGPAWFGLILLAWAPLVSLARVSLGVHYLSDIVAGMALGAVMGGIVLFAIR
jgi:undecaprenyl-diphosphatase